MVGAAITDDQIQAFLNALPHASLLLDFQGTILGANEAAQHLFEDCAGRKLEELAMDAPSAERIRGFFTQSQLTQHLSATLTHQILNPQGEHGRVAWTLKALPGTADPRIIASAQQIVIQTAEISDNATLDGESFRAAVEYSTNGLILLDQALTIRYWNPAARRLFGYDIKQVLGQPVENLIKPEERARWAGLTDVLQSAPNDFAITHEVECLRRNGTTFTAELTFTVWFREAVRNITLRVRDLTVVRHTDARLRQLSQAVENSPTSIVITDSEGLIEYVNPKFEELTGYALEEVRGQTPRILSSGNKTRDEYESLWQTIKSGQVWRGEFLNKRKDGSFYWELASISPILDEHGRISNFVAVKEDISQRKALEQRLRQLSRAVENSPVSIVITDAQGLVEYVNPRFVELTGYSTEDVHGKLLRALRVGSLPEEELKTLWEALRAGQSWRGEFLNKRKDGSFYWEMASISPLLNEHGELINLIAVREDISERKLMEQRLRLSEARYRSVVDSQSEMVWRFTPGFVITFVNETLCHYLNRRPEELLMASVFDVLPADQHEQVRQFMGLLTPEEPAREWEIPVVPGHGEQRWHVWRDLALFDENGRVVEYQSVGRDVTERKRVEEALRQVNQRLELHLEQTPLAVIEHDMEFRILRWNPAAEQVFGYSEAEMLGREAWLLLSDDVRPSVEAIKEDIYSSGQPRKSINQNVCKDGRVITCEWYNTPLVNDAGEVIGAVSMAQDVTERERAAAALKESEATLASAQEIARLGSWELSVGSPHGIWSQQMFRLFDLEPADQPPDFETYLGRIHPDDRAIVRDALDKMLAGEVPNGREYRSNPELLPLRWFHPTWQVETDADGKPVRFFGTLQDITERKLAEDALRMANQRLALHMQYAPLGVIEQDANFVITRWNPAAEKIFGYSAQEAIGQPDTLVWAPHLLEQAEEMRNLLRSQRGPQYNTGESLRKDGQLITCEWYNTPLVNEAGETIGFASLVLDITERKLAEDALRLANQRLALHLRQTSLAVVEYDTEFRVVGWNQAAERIFGFSTEEVLGQDSNMIIAPESRSHVATLRARMHTERTEQHSINYNLRKDGQHIICEWYNTPLIDESGEVIGYTALALDITERKQAEDALRLANQRLATHLTNTPLAVVEFDADFNIIGWNHAAERIFGYSAEEAIGQNDYLLWLPERHAIADETHHRLLRESVPAVGTGETRRKDGSIVTCEWYSTPLLDEGGQMIGVASLALDVTERKQAEEALRQANQRLALHITNTPLAVIEYDVDFNIIGWNQSAEQIFGFSAEEAIGQTDLLVWAPGREELVDKVRATLRSRSNQKGEGPAYRKDGRLIHCEWYNTALVNEADEIIGFASLVLDITERKQAEDALRLANQRLALHITNTPLAVIEYDVDFNIIGWNQSAEQIFGFSAEEAIGQTDLLVWMPERAHLAEGVSRKLRAKLAGFTRGPTDRKDGRLIYCDWFNTALVNEADEIIGFASLALDTTERKQAEDALRQANQRLALHITHTPLAVIEYDADFRIIGWNQAAERIFGFSAEEAIGRDDYFLWMLEEREVADHMHQRLLTTGLSERGVGETRRKDGTIIICEWYNTPLVDATGAVIGVAALALDVTERMRAEEALRQANQRLALHLDQTPMAVIEWDLDFRVTRWNPAAERIFGHSEVEALGQYASFILPPDLHEFGEEVRRDIYQRQSGQRNTNENLHKDGRIILCEWYNTPLVDDSGQIIGAASLALDVTERRQAEDALAESEARYRAIVEDQTEFVTRFDAQGRLTFVNDAVLKYLQRSEEDVEGLTFSEVIYAEDLPHVMESIASLTPENPVASVEQRIYRGDGVLRWHLWTNHALFDEAGKLTGYQGVGRDITEEKALSEAIRKSEANLRAILDHTRVAYLLFDLEGRLVMVNPAAKESARTFLNMELTEGVMVSELLSGDLQADFRKNFARALNDQSTRSEMYVDTPDGRQRWFELHYQPIRIENGAMLGAFVSIDEITERRDAEKRRLALELEHKRVEIISNFVRDASHEFRNPLTMINTAAGLMSRSDDPARRAQKAQQVESQIQRITRLLDDLLMMAELDGSPRMNLTTVDPNLVLRMLSLRIAERAKSKHQTIETSLAEDLPLISGDLQWLNEAVLRVADNSLRYCPEGATIRVESRRSGEELVLSICDNGEGIPLEAVPQIFDRFYRAGRSPTEAGFGLGLAIVRRIVELHGGRAEVETHPGEGICFRLIFPVAEQNTPERRRN